MRQVGLPAGQAGGGEEAAEVSVAPLVLAEEGEVMARLQGDLGAGDRAQASGAGAPSELHRPADAVVVGEGEGIVAQPARPQHQPLDVRGAFEEGEVGVAVEFGARHH